MSLVRNPIAGLGLFSVFGTTRRDRDWLTGLFSDRLGIVPTVISFSNNESCFYYTNHGEIQETDESICLKLGFLRSSDGTSLVIDQNNEQKLNPHDFENGPISGNGYLIRFHKLEPRFTIFMTFMATSQVYHMLWEGGVLCSTDVRVLLKISDEIRLNEKAVPLHLIYRSVPGPMTHFKDVFRVFPGEIIAWRNGALETRHLRNMCSTTDKPAYDHLDDTVYEEYFEKLSGIMNSYVREIERSNGRMANQLSGGVDSAVLQLLLERQTPRDQAPPTFSYAWEADSFQFEVGYARLASELLGTKHTSLDIKNEDYADLLVRAVEALGQPNVHAEHVPGQLALAEFLAADYPELHYVFTGLGADVLHGIGRANPVGSSDRHQDFPGHYALREFYKLLAVPIHEKGLGGLRDVLRFVFTPDAYGFLRTAAGLLDAASEVDIPYTSLETVRHFLGDQVLLDSLERAHRLTEETLTSHTSAERVHDIATINDGYDAAAASQTLFSASRRVLIPFYFDQEVIRLVKSVSPEVRYIRNGEVKPILKSILRRKSLDRIVHQKKGASGFHRDLQSWMMNGPLREMVHSIERPGFIGQRDFTRLIENRYPFGYDLVWPLLIYDIFRKHVAEQYCPRGSA
jgi:asparagine synthetase B (glutamine-hydrolysing)